MLHLKTLHSSACAAASQCQSTPSPQREQSRSSNPTSRATSNTPARSCAEHSGDYVEWKNIHDDLHDFLAELQHIAAQKPPAALQSVQATPPPIPTTNEEHTAWITAAKARAAYLKHHKQNHSQNHSEKENCSPTPPLSGRDPQPETLTSERPRAAR